MDQQSRYLKDTTGFNPSNLVKAEPHFLTQQVKNRVVVPREGAFFSKTVTLLDRFKNRNLIQGKDFICAGLRVKLTQELGQEICSFVIITNDEVSHGINITYQTVGNEAQSLSESTVDTLETDYSDSKDVPLFRLKNVPKKFVPTFHYQDLGDIDKFEYMLFSLEKIRNALLFDSREVFKYITRFDEYLLRLFETSTNFFQAELYRKMRSYTDKFKKDLYGLALVENLPPFLKDDGTYIASLPVKLFGTNEEAYLTFEALASYSTELYELLVNVKETGLGSSKEFKVDVSVSNFEALPIGSQFTIANYSFSHRSEDPLVDIFYPDRLDLTTGYVVKKLSARNTISGSMFLYIGQNNSRTYVMRLISTDKGYTSHFSKIVNISDSPPIFFSIQEHIDNRENPHLDDKRDVDLAQVENLPIATMEDIICNMPVRKYITLTQLYAYMKRFKTGKKEISEIYENFSERTVGKRLQTLFSPCGAWDDNIDVDKIEMCRPAEIEIITTTTTTTTRAPATYAVVPNVPVLHGGETVIFDITTTNLDNGTVIYWSAELLGITPERFANNNLSGEVSMIDNKASVSIILKDDETTNIQPIIVEELFNCFVLNGEEIFSIDNAQNGDVYTIKITGEYFEPEKSLSVETRIIDENQYYNVAYWNTEVVTDENGSFTLYFEWSNIDIALPVSFVTYASSIEIPYNSFGPSNEITVVFSSGI